MKRDEQKRYDIEQIRRQTVFRLFGSAIISLGIVFVVFAGTLYLFPWSTLLPNAVAHETGPIPIDWNLLEGITSLAALSLLVGGAVFAVSEHTQNSIQQRRESALASFDIYRELFDRLMNPVDVESRRWLIQNVPTLEKADGDAAVWLIQVKAKLNEFPEGWNQDRPPGKEHLKRVLNTFDFIGFSARFYWNMDNELVEWLSPAVSKTWERVYLFVEDEAERRNEADYYRAARDFGDYCVEWRRTHLKESSVIIEDAT